MEELAKNINLNNDNEVAEEQNLHKFIDAFNGVSLEKYKMALKKAYDSGVAQSDSNFATGSKELRKVVVPIARTATIMASKACASDYRSHLKDQGKAGAKLDKAITSRKLTIDSLCSMSNKELKKQLKSCGFSRKERHLVLNNKEYYQGMFLFRDELKSYVKGTKHEKYINSADFFFMNKKESAKLLKMYMKRSKDDAIRNVTGWDRKSAKSLKKFLKKAPKNGVSENGIHAVKMQQRLNKLRRANMISSKIVNRDVAYALYRLRHKTKEADDNARIGAEKLLRAGQVTYVGYRVLIGKHKCGIVALPVRVGLKVSIKFGAALDRLCVKYNLLYRRSFGKAITKVSHKATNTVLKAGIAAKKGTKAAAKKVGKYTVNKSKKVLKATFGNSKSVKAIKEARKKTVKAAKKMAQTKAARAACISARKLGKGAKVTGKVGLTVVDYGIFKPLRGIRTGIGKFFSIVEKLKYVLIGMSLIIVAVYVLIALLFSVTQSMQNYSQLSSTTILGPEDTSVYDKVVYLQGLLDDRKAKARERGEGTPKTTLVAAGQTIDRYGHPEKDVDGSIKWTKGYKIYYRDSAGNLMADGSNNIKDTIILAYVGEDGEWEKSDSLDSTIDEYWEYLNPEFTEDNLIETDIYCCADGCNEYSYSCNDSSAYDFMDRISSEGGHIYSSIAPSTSEGCKSRTVKKTGIRLNDSTHLPELYTYDDIEYYCPGHSVDVCYGHRDVEIHLDTYFMQDAFDNNYTAGTIFQSLSSWEADEIEWCNSLYDTDWFDSYGIDPMGGFGFIVEGSYSPEEIAALLENLDVDDTKRSIVNNAISLVGKVPYYWGGKPTEFGVYPFSTTAGGKVGSTVKPDEKGRTLAGVDCYGFVQYCYNSTVSGLLPTSTTKGMIDQNGLGLRAISAKDLSPGDIGVFYKNGSGGHIGIFYGYDDNGSALWIHCTGMPRNNVVLSTCGFDHYYTIP